jgi:hypothetical protein
MMIVSLFGVITGLTVFRGQKILFRLMLAALGLGAAAAVVMVMIFQESGSLVSVLGPNPVAICNLGIKGLG